MKHAASFRRELLAWYRAEARDLPWRRTRDPYKIWLAEIILQQTRVDQGLPYYERYAVAYPTVEDLAKAKEDQVLKLWEGLGYYTRARNMHKTARIIVEQYGGNLPGSAEVLQMLPGIGRYTAGAIASIAFNERVPVLDGNVKRVLTRLFDLDGCIDLPEVEQELWILAGTLVPQQKPGDFNQAMMELGARVCTPKQPRCDLCPGSAFCEARARGVQEQRPVRKGKKPPPHQEIVVAVLEREGRYLVGRRPPQGLLGGLWEFPGGKVIPGETHQQALERECREELGIEVRAGGLIASVKHAYTHLRVTLNVYRCRLLKGEPRPKTHTQLRWLAPAEFKRYAFPKANHKFIHLIE
jgi:A/G-specific adenine glycosylase